MFERVYRKQIIIAVNKTIDFKILTEWLNWYTVDKLL